jgi:4-diphosphocytidyl-2-C-methyl-D-erythritol kinase
MNSLVLHPHAKINLGLRVLGLRPDGYHELRTRFQTIDLTDELILVSSRTGLSLEVEGASLPADESNLVMRAARALMEGRPGLPGVRLTLRKRIPMAAGLGGGSSDAAATLLGLNRLWRLGLATKDLAVIASRLGSDLGFFLVGGSALGAGRGDEISPLPDCVAFRIALVLSPLASPTAEIYRLWDGRNIQASPGNTDGGPASADPIREPSRDSVWNDLEGVVLARHPQLRVYREILLRHGAKAVALSGSGSSIYGLYSRQEEVHQVQSDPAWGEVQVLDCSPVRRGEYWQRLGLPLSD